jgi:hypothetical protein
VTLLTFGEILDEMLARISINANARNQSDHVLRALLAPNRIQRSNPLTSRAHGTMDK